jgi:hypothetical protein
MLFGQKPPATAWDGVFKAANTNADAVQVPPTKWRGGGTYALPVFNACWDDWRLLEPTTEGLTRQLLRQADQPADALATAGLLLSAKIPPMPKTERQSLKKAILACGGTSPLDEPKLDAALSAVPRDVAEAAAEVLMVMPDAARLRQKSLDTITAVGTPEVLAPETLAFSIGYDTLQPHSLAVLDKFDVGPMIAASELVAQAAEKLRGRHLSGKLFHFEWPTTIGKIELSGPGNDSLNLDGVLFALDTGGSDTFTGSPLKPGLTTVISYGNHNSFVNCGFAAFGISEIFDFGDVNSFVCKDGGNGAAVCGVSLVFSSGEKNTYQGHDLTEGAAFDGVGLLLDLGAHGTYKCRSISQGFGGVKGFGALVNPRGNCLYDADDKTIDNPSPQTAQHNVSMSQGAGFGRRADPGDGHSMAGGVGVLVNGGDDNSFSCGVFGQGVAYWYSLGCLATFGKHNKFNGVWYVQGSAAHYSLAVNLGFGGHDTYTATMAQSNGQGHDYSIGMLHTRGGNDLFNCQGGALGSGRWNGIGFFCAKGNNNQFSALGESYGFAADHRPAESCFGFFAAPGRNIYAVAPKEVGQGKTWFFQKQPIPPVIGSGMAGK